MLSACGQKGPLYLPEDDGAATTADERAGTALSSPGESPADAGTSGTDSRPDPHSRP
ncbi:MAG: lipoprotein [Lautropia sp.]|nr:lipoprotein [Lautropia sp.]